MNRSSKIYFDYAATTPVDPRVLEKMFPFFSEEFGNPSSVHSYGQQAEAALENARQVVADGLNTSSDEIVFTANGTESDNLAIRGVAIAAKKRNNANHILISPVEHHAVSLTARQLSEYYGFELEFLPVDQYGMVDPDEVKKRIRPTTALVSVIFANNEIGTVNPIKEIGAVCKNRNVPFHTDAVQAAAHLPINVQELNIDLLSLGAHKFYGPKGIGALFIRKGIQIVPSQTGGGQEGGMRAGTQNIPYIVGLAEADNLTRQEHTKRNNLLQPMRDQIIGAVLETIPDVQLTGHPISRLPNHASFAFSGLDGNLLLMLLDANGFACSSGSACKTGNPEPSEVLLAMGCPREYASGSLRITLGTGNHPGQILDLLNELPVLVDKARSLKLG